jgi:hypothetical protein
MEELNYERLRKCEKLYLYQKDNFDFYSGIDFEDEFFPIPIRERELINEKKLNVPYESYKAYVSGFEKGYSLPLPLTDDLILSWVHKNYRELKYLVSDGLVDKKSAINFGRKVGKIYSAWEEVIRRIDDFMPLLEQKTNKDTLIPLIKDNYTVRLKMIHAYLKDGKYIDCSENDFLYWFGNKEMSKKPSKIHWLKADSVLKNVIHQLCGTSGEDYIKIAFIFKNNYVSSNYQKYVGSDMYHEIKGFIGHSTEKI